MGIFQNGSAAARSSAAQCLAEGRIRDIVFEDHVGSQSAVCRFLRQHGYTLFSLSWRLRGLHVELAERDARATDYEAQGFLATKSPREVLLLCGNAGWRVLKKL